MSENNEQINDILKSIPSIDSSEVKKTFSMEDELLIKNINSVKNLMQAGILQEDAAKDFIQKITLTNFKHENQKVHEDTQNEPEASEIPINADKKISVSDKYSEIIDYLKSSGTNFKAEDWTQISAMLSTIENQAVERYRQEVSHNAALNRENENDKKRLTSYAQNSTGEINLSRQFSREEIGSMSRDEFDRNEKQIMYQLSRGLIK